MGARCVQFFHLETARPPAALLAQQNTLPDVRRPARRKRQTPTEQHGARTRLESTRYSIRHGRHAIGSHPLLQWPTLARALRAVSRAAHFTILDCKVHASESSRGHFTGAKKLPSHPLPSSHRHIPEALYSPVLNANRQASAAGRVTRTQSLKLVVLRSAQRTFTSPGPWSLSHDSSDENSFTKVIL